MVGVAIPYNDDECHNWRNSFVESTLLTCRRTGMSTQPAFIALVPQGKRCFEPYEDATLVFITGKYDFFKFFIIYLLSSHFSFSLSFYMLYLERNNFFSAIHEFCVVYINYMATFCA